MRRGSARPGVILVEVLVALAMLGASGAALAAMAVGATDSVRRAQQRDADIRRASALLEAVALWPREDLDRHLGARPQGAWVLDVQHPSPSLYTVSIADSGVALTLLQTALFRPIPRLAEGAVRAP